jgi:hypothetical protein
LVVRVWRIDALHNRFLPPEIPIDPVLSMIRLRKSSKRMTAFCIFADFELISSDYSWCQLQGA